MNELNPTPKIEKRTQVSKSGAKVSSEAKAKLENAPEDKVTLSKSSRDESAKVKNDSPVTSDVRYDLINKYRNFLGNGTYQVKADEIADKIVQKIRESKNHHLL